MRKTWRARREVDVRHIARNKIEHPFGYYFALASSIGEKNILPLRGRFALASSVEENTVCCFAVASRSLRSGVSIIFRFGYCRRKELMASVRKPREKLCASAFHPSKTRKKGTKSGRLRRPLCVRVFRVLEGWNSLAHSFSRGFRTPAIKSFRRQYNFSFRWRIFICFHTRDLLYGSNACNFHFRRHLRAKRARSARARSQRARAQSARFAREWRRK